MIPDLEEAPIHGYVAPVHVQHHDVARRDAHHGVPGTPTQQMGTGPADPGPALGLEPRRCHWSKRNAGQGDRKSTRLNSSHVRISYAVFCLKKKNISVSSILLWARSLTARS